ncbi:MAG: C4-dicarboxylate ABC transporter, partial [Pseudomonadota bacterium]
MSNKTETDKRRELFPNRAVYLLALFFVFVGIVNSMPTIPGWDDLWREITGMEKLKVRSFATEWFYPIVFFIMMCVVALRHSMWRDWRGTARAGFGAFMDVALVLAAAAISLTYLIEIDSVCLIDTITGERARLIAETLKAEIAFAEDMGLPAPDTVDDPKCVSTTGVWLVAIMGLSMLVFLGYNIKVWGLPLVMVSLLVALYTIGT